MNSPIDRMTSAQMHAVLDYLSEEIEIAESKEDLEAVLKLAREMLAPSPMQNVVQGLGHLRAEVDHSAIARAQSGTAGPECTVQLAVPQILSETFQDLSTRMRTLQNEDPDTFANATSALTWLASGEISAN